MKIRNIFLIGITLFVTSCLQEHHIIKDYRKAITENDAYSKLTTQRLNKFADNNKEDILKRFKENCDAYKGGESLSDIAKKRLDAVVKPGINNILETTTPEELERVNKEFKKNKVKWELRLTSLGLEATVLERNCGL